MVSAPRGETGAGRLGCLLTLLLFVAAVYYGVHVGEVYFRYYQLRDEMQVQARLAPGLEDATIRRRLAARVDELDLPPAAGQFRIRRTTRPPMIRIETTYTETVDLPFFKHTFKFTPHAEEHL